MNFFYEGEEQNSIKELLARRQDPESERLKRFLAMPDLSRTPGSPIYELAQIILTLKDFKDFDVIEVPEIARADISFDLFNFPKDHPARNKTDTYFLNDEYILRTHTTIMWYYYLAQKEIKEKIKNGLPVGALCYGKVYRKDEIDRNHMNIFHQMDGWYLCRKSDKIITIEDLQNVLASIAKAVFGQKVKYRFNQDQFPYTDPSVEMEIDKSSLALHSGAPEWVEVLGSGVVRGTVLKNLGVDAELYNGWAFGFGLERLAIVSMELPDIRLLWSTDERVKKQLHVGNKYKVVSKFPPITRDVSFVVPKDFAPNDYYDLIRDIGGGLVEEMKLLDAYANADKFGAERMSYTFRIVYRSNERTLLSLEVDTIQDKIYLATAEQFKAEIR